MKGRYVILVTTLLSTRLAGAVVVPAPGYAVRSIALPGPVRGAVARRADAILVGQGANFTAGAQSIIRLTEGGTPTTIAAGFNSLGGFDLGPDGTLYVVDNCFSDNGDGCGTTVTGDTVYAIPDALTRTSAVAAAGQELVPAGTIPAAMDVLALRRGGALVSDSAGNDIGRVVRVAGGSSTDLVTSLDFAGGLALACDRTLMVGDVDADTFAGRVFRYSLRGRPDGTLAGGLSGAFAHVFDADANLLVSGGFTGDFSSSTVVAIAPNGTVTERAHGFGFSTEMAFDVLRDEALALDFGVAEISAICRDRDGDGECDADDNCPAVANAGQADADADGLGDVCDCAAPVTLTGVKVKIGELTTPPGDETLRVKGEMTVPFPFAPALDPVANGMRLRITDTAGRILDASIPPGSGWEVNGAGTAWRYRNCSGLYGIDSVSLKHVSRTPGRLRIAVKGKRGSYPIVPANLPLAVTVVLDTTGQCGDAVAADCALSGSGKTLRCG